MRAGCELDRRTRTEAVDAVALVLAHVDVHAE